MLCSVTDVESLTNIVWWLSKTVDNIYSDFLEGYKEAKRDLINDIVSLPKGNADVQKFNLRLLFYLFGNVLLNSSVKSLPNSKDCLT